MEENNEEKGEKKEEKKVEMCVPAPCREHVDIFPHGAGLLLPLLSFPCGGGMPATVLEHHAVLLAAAGS